MPGEQVWNSTQILMMPGLFSVIGFFMIMLSMISFKNTGDLPKWRWITLIVRAVGLFFGATWLWRFLDPSVEAHAYRQTITTRLMQFAHFVAPLIPAVLIGLYFFVESRMKAKAALEA